MLSKFYLITEIYYSNFKHSITLYSPKLKMAPKVKLVFDRTILFLQIFSITRKLKTIESIRNYIQHFSVSDLINSMLPTHKKSFLCILTFQEFLPYLQMVEHFLQNILENKLNPSKRKTLSLFCPLSLSPLPYPLPTNTHVHIYIERIPFFQDDQPIMKLSQKLPLEPTFLHKSPI